MRRWNETISMKTRNTADHDTCSGTTRHNPSERRRQPVVTRAVSKRGKLPKSADAPALTAVAKTGGRTKLTGRTIECIDYKGYTLKIEPQRSGWKVAIFPNGSPFALHRIPCTSESSGREAVIEQAKAIIDAAGAVPTLQQPATEPEDTSESWVLSLELFLLRIRNVSLQWWTNTAATLKRVYFSIDTRSNCL